MEEGRAYLINQILTDLHCSPNDTFLQHHLNQYYFIQLEIQKVQTTLKNIPEAPTRSQMETQFSLSINTSMTNGLSPELNHQFNNKLHNLSREHLQKQISLTRETWDEYLKTLTYQLDEEQKTLFTILDKRHGNHNEKLTIKLAEQKAILEEGFKSIEKNCNKITFSDQMLEIKQKYHSKTNIVNIPDNQKPPLYPTHCETCQHPTFLPAGKTNIYKCQHCLKDFPSHIQHIQRGFGIVYLPDLCSDCSNLLHECQICRSYLEIIASNKTSNTKISSSMKPKLSTGEKIMGPPSIRHPPTGPTSSDSKGEIPMSDETSENKRDVASQYAYQAFLCIRNENYTKAISLATKAIETDPTYPKGFFRRGCAYLALRKFNNALSDFKKNLQLRPNDRMAQAKVSALQREMHKIEYGHSIMQTPTTPSDNINIKNMFNTRILKNEMSNASGEHVGFDRNFIFEMIQRFRHEKLIQKKYALYILCQAINIFKKYPSVYKVNVKNNHKLTVCGDTHGQFYDLLNIFEMNGYPSSDNPYIFNGDFVDRGSFSCEVIFTLLAFKVSDPNCIHLTRGNHEDREMNHGFGFEGEVNHKYGEEMFDIFIECFNWMPLGILLNERVFITHGGVGFEKRNVTLAELEKIDRFREIPENGLMCDMLWSDPMPENGLKPSDRGVSSLFGEDVLMNFLQTNKLDLLIRSHEMQDEGYDVMFGGKLITIFSAPNYVDYAGNKGAYIILDGTNLNQRNKPVKTKFVTFTAVQHPDVRPMFFADPLYSDI